MLILAGISLSGLIGGKGLFQRTEKASGKYNEAKAREVLETVLLTDGQFEKNTNPKYNQDDFLDELIKKEIPGSDVRGDVAIIGEYAYELDRSVPKIGRYVGKEEDIVWPKVDATVKLADDKKDATITITASEEKQGINKIEIWLLGEMIKEYTYDPAKPEATENYTATQNGEYTIKAYGDLMASKTVEVIGIMPGIEFEPNGNTIWKKEHSTKIKVQETEEKIKSMKYVWTNSVIEPADNTFTENCKAGDTITKNEVTGKYYLWILLETEGGAKAKRRSEGFYFDNEGPNIIEFTSDAITENEIKLTVEAQDIGFGIIKFEFYVDNELKDIQMCEVTNNNITKIISIENLTPGYHTCKVIVYDNGGFSNEKQINAETKKYVWACYNVETKTNVSENTTTEDLTIPWGTTVKLYSSRGSQDKVNLKYTKPSTASKTINGSSWVSSNYFISEFVNYYYFSSDNKYVYKLINASINREKGAMFKPATKYFLETSTSRIQGTTKYSNTSSFYYDSYPRNGEKNGRWYVLQ